MMGTHRDSRVWLMLSSMFLMAVMASSVSAADRFTTIDGDYHSKVLHATADANGAVYLTAKYRGNSHFGTIKRFSASHALVAAKARPDGSFVWVEDIPSRPEDVILMRDEFRVLVHTEKEDRGRKTEEAKLQVIRFSLDGKRLSAKTVATFQGGRHNIYLKGFFDRDGDVIVLGRWTDQSPKLNGKKLRKKMYSAMALAKVNMDGVVQWTQQVEAGNNGFTQVYPAASAVDAKNQVYVAVYFGKEVRIGKKTARTKLEMPRNSGPIPLFHRGVLLMKLSPTGELLAAEHIARHKADVESMDIDDQGRVLLGGFYRGNDTIKRADGKPQDPRPLIGGLALPDAPDEAAFAAQLSANFKGEWVQSWPTLHGSRIHDIAAHGGQALAVGAFRHVLKLGGKSYTSVGKKTDSFLVRLSPDGKEVSHSTYPGEGSETLLIGTTRGKQILIFGAFRGDMQIGGRRVHAKGRHGDGFLYLRDP